MTDVADIRGRILALEEDQSKRKEERIRMNKRYREFNDKALAGWVAYFNNGPLETT
jgi:hypothetical protein